MIFKKILKTKGIKEILLVVMLLAIAGSILLIKDCNKEVGGYVEVTINGVKVNTYPLDVDATYTLNNGTNILVIEDGYAFMKEANCPDYLCIKQGKIKYNGQSITCLPNKINVKVVAANSGVDIIS